MELFSFYDDLLISALKKLSKLNAEYKIPYCIGQLKMSYADPDRSYHNYRHIEYCFRQIMAINAMEFSNMEEMIVAMAYHDVIYTPGSKKNEENSVKRMFVDMSALGLDMESINIIAYYIKSTDHSINSSKLLGSEKPLSVDSKKDIRRDMLLMRDIDLLILSEKPEIYLEYEAGIRKEYLNIPLKEYAVGRINILEKFKNKSSIYSGDHLGKGGISYFIGCNKLAKKNLTGAINFWKNFK